MPVTELDPHTALIVVDLQKAILGMVEPSVVQPVLERAGDPPWVCSPWASVRTSAMSMWKKPIG